MHRALLKDSTLGAGPDIRREQHVTVRASFVFKAGAYAPDLVEYSQCSI